MADNTSGERREAASAYDSHRLTIDLRKYFKDKSASEKKSLIKRVRAMAVHIRTESCEKKDNNSNVLSMFYTTIFESFNKSYCVDEPPLARKHPNIGEIFQRWLHVDDVGENELLTNPVLLIGIENNLELVFDLLRLEIDIRAVPGTYEDGRKLAFCICEMAKRLDGAGLKEKVSEFVDDILIHILRETIKILWEDSQKYGQFCDAHPKLGELLQYYLNEKISGKHRSANDWNNLPIFFGDEPVMSNSTDLTEIAALAAQRRQNLAVHLTTVLPFNCYAARYEFNLKNLTYAGGKPLEFKFKNILHAAHDPRKILEYLEVDEKGDMFLLLKGAPNDAFAGPRMVWFGVEPKREQTKDGLKYLNVSKYSNRYGPVVFVVSMKKAWKTFEPTTTCSLGTRIFKNEHSHATLVLDVISGAFANGLEKVASADRNYPPTKFAASDCSMNPDKFDHPEFAFATDELRVPLEYVKVRFVKHSVCVKEMKSKGGYRCGDELADLWEAGAARACVIEKLRSKYDEDFIEGLLEKENPSKTKLDAARENLVAKPPASLAAPGNGENSKLPAVADA